MTGYEANWKRWSSHTADSAVFNSDRRLFFPAQSDAGQEFRIVDRYGVYRRFTSGAKNEQGGQQDDERADPVGAAVHKLSGPV